MRMEKKYIVRRRIMKLVGIVLMLIGAAVMLLCEGTAKTATALTVYQILKWMFVGILLFGSGFLAVQVVSEK